jgi:hypothetical protein
MRMRVMILAAMLGLISAGAAAEVDDATPSGLVVIPTTDHAAIARQAFARVNAFGMS